MQLLKGRTPGLATRCVVLAVVAVAAAVSVNGCRRGARDVASSNEIPGAQADRGPHAIQQYGCGSCHTIPGVRSATATVGPPLTAWSRRTYIAGILPNTPENLIRWIEAPQSVLPGNAMPNMQVTPADAADIAAYLYAIH
jgi:cytochrome c